jgi:hypothetical protein
MGNRVQVPWVQHLDTYRVTYWNHEWEEMEHLSFTGAGYLTATAAVSTFLEHRISVRQGLGKSHHELNEVLAITLEIEDV